MIRHAWREREEEEEEGAASSEREDPLFPLPLLLTADNRGVTDGQKKEKGEKNSLAAPAETGSLGGPSSWGEREKRLDSPPPFFPFCLSAACAEYDRVEVFPKRVNALFSFFFSCSMLFWLTAWALSLGILKEVFFAKG